ncbi:hypothetical protein MKQ68_19025 [Chitinophaga horti]|uniref:Uncharacterized protein n=1 Tax=Chitinophaga horti TaxID=2920382 RepID=A0ABY6IXS1_9BACT|nr:hypothetical protein [Chitinophaga horti]UYQ92183.1 hypothetical protein MKQ68_19025 [Chitinophaga horti]
MAGSEIGKFVEMMFSLPAMKAPVKFEMKKSVKLVFVISRLIERGLAPGGSADPVLDLLSAEDIEELQQAKREMLEKVDLLDLNEKLKAFSK